MPTVLFEAKMIGIGIARFDSHKEESRINYGIAHALPIDIRKHTVAIEALACTEFRNLVHSVDNETNQGRRRARRG